VLVDERGSGEARRQLLLGENLDPGRLTADLDRGVLVLTIPVAEESKPRRVEIHAAPHGQERLESGDGQRERGEASEQGRRAATAGRS
jgi:HSP20 family protein